ncbi:MAG: hypothetical protein AAFW73_26705, partial [Bacteroidota bacterium]
MSIQEPPTKGGRVSGFGPSISCYYDKKSKDPPRAAILASKNIYLWPVAEFTSRDIVTCLWTPHPGREILVVSAYLDITERNVIPTQLLALMRHSRRKGREVLLCADTNAHSSLWNCPDTNSRGERLEEFILEHGVTVQNVGDHFTFFRGEARTIIDVTMTTGANLETEVTNWHVSEEVMGSDHLLIQFTLPISSHKKYQTRNFVKGDWPLFTQVLETRMEELALTPLQWTPAEVNYAAEQLQEAIYDALNESHPIHSVPVRIKSLPSMNEELSRWKKRLKACYSNYRKRRSLFAWEQFHDCRKEYRRLVRRAKREHWQNFCEEADTPPKASFLHKVIQGRTNQEIGLMKKPDGATCRDGKESIQTMVDTHFPGHVPTLASSPALITYQMADINDPFVSFITEDKVKEAIQSFGDYKAPGPDGNKPCVLKHFGALALTRLTSIFKASLLLGFTPKVWRESRVVF